ncbi:hypothetical protein [Aquiflexum gelatinilyticum]|uniref:hypothetical protein n=1 Tax=Aquiflexum gelatinilyticum TaxID=2961943 RepID=UPI002167F4CB|nr:hypothetical protein [Aquiflexum gelatinilyticum]MCS4436577.1 hypothetical protein [Aquiflexum gelatinilyticum]
MKTSMKVKSIIIMFFFILMFNSCKTKNNEIKVKLLKPEREIESIKDLYYIANINLVSNEDQIFIVDRSQGVLIATDKNFDPQYLINNKGDGPGELQQPINVVYQNDTLFIEDIQNRRMNFFQSNSGRFLNSFKIPFATTGKRFSIDLEGNFLFSRLPDESGNAITKTNKKGEKLFDFGSKIPDPFSRKNNQSKLVQVNENNEYIVTSVTFGVLEIYNSKGKILSSIDLKEYEPIKRGFDSLKVDLAALEKEEDKRSIPQLILDSQVIGEMIFITFTDRIGLDRSGTRHLLELQLKNNEIYLRNIYRFVTGSEDDDYNFMSFHYDKYERKIYAQGLITNKLYVFPMDTK